MSRLFKRKPSPNPPSDVVTTKRLLIIGSSGHSGAKCVRWDSENLSNVADFDVVIVNVASLTTQLQDVAQKRDENKWKQLRGNVDTIRQGFVKLLDSNGEIYAVATLSAQADIGSGWIESRYMSNYHWCPLPLEVVPEEGETLLVEDAAFSRYLGNVRQWRFIIQTLQNSRVLDWIAEYHGNRFQVRLAHVPIAKNRYGRLLAAKFYYQLHRCIPQEDFMGRETLMVQRAPERTSGHLVLLPLPTEVSDRDAINIILEDLFDLPQQTLAPEWVAQVPVPGHAELAEAKGQRRQEIERLSSEIHQIEDQIAHLDTYKQLLYETGTPLETICKQVIAEMGGEVRPAEISEEDFIVEFEGQRAIVEVKGNTKSISLADLSQLGRFREDYAIARGMEIKGILLGNAWRLLPLGDRTEVDFPPNVIEYARPRGISLVNTAELYRAYCVMLEGKVEGRDVLHRLFAGVGVTSLVG